jgi:hypothetical protein
MEAGKNSVIYMGLISGPNKSDDTCGPTTITGKMDRGFTVLYLELNISVQLPYKLFCKFHKEETTWEEW